MLIVDMRDQPENFQRCMQELADAIRRSERWIAGMESELAELERRSPRNS
jgi:hypothetical protein